MYSQFIRKQYFTVDSLIWSQSVTDFLQYTIIFLRWDFLAKCPAELWFLLVTLWGLISLRAFEREKLILTACAKYNVSWQNPKPSREGPSRFELNSGFQRWQAVALSHRHLVLPIAGKAKKKKLKGIWFKSQTPSLQMKIVPQTLTGREFSWHAVPLLSREQQECATHNCEIHEDKKVLLYKTMHTMSMTRHNQQQLTRISLLPKPQQNANPEILHKPLLPHGLTKQTHMSICSSCLSLNLKSLDT